jgi:hypothetical protein
MDRYRPNEWQRNLARVYHGDSFENSIPLSLAASSLALYNTVSGVLCPGESEWLDE